jgi:hypothetical protein
MKVREATFKKRVELLPKAYEVEAELLDSGDNALRLKTAHKIFDDTGVGHSRTPHSVAINIFNQKENQTSEFMLGMVKRYGQEALKIAAGETIDAEYTEDSTNSEPDKQDVIETDFEESENS